MNIKSQKDFFSGLMFMGVGVAFAWGAAGYTVGNGARMGPGYFPLVLGVLLAVLGGIITFKALVVETVDGDKIGAWAWRPLFFIIMAPTWCSAFCDRRAAQSVRPAAAGAWCPPSTC